MWTAGQGGRQGTARRAQGTREAEVKQLHITIAAIWHVGTLWTGPLSASSCIQQLTAARRQSPAHTLAAAPSQAQAQHCNSHFSPCMPAHSKMEYLLVVRRRAHNHHRWRSVFKDTRLMWRGWRSLAASPPRQQRCAAVQRAMCERRTHMVNILACMWCVVSVRPKPRLPRLL